MLLEILIAGGVIMLASLSGVVFATKATEGFVASRLSFLVSFSAGVFLVTSGALALEVFEIYAGFLWQGIALILVGYGLAWAVETLLPESHHHHDPNEHDGHTHERRGARKLLIGDSIHNIGDGIILVPAFVASPVLGLAVTVSIFIHETLQGISEFFVLKQAGFSTKKTLLLSFLTNGSVLVGIVLSYYALASHELEGILLSVSCGFFLHLVIHDLLPKRAEHQSLRIFLQHVVVVALGLALMAFINITLSEEGHSHGDGVDIH